MDNIITKLDVNRYFIEHREGSNILKIMEDLNQKQKKWVDKTHFKFRGKTEQSAIKIWGIYETSYSRVDQVKFVEDNP